MDRINYVCEIKLYIHQITFHKWKTQFVVMQLSTKNLWMCKMYGFILESANRHSHSRSPPTQSMKIQHKTIGNYY